MADLRTPAWLSKPLSVTLPAGLILALATAAIGAASAGGVGIATREGDLSLVEVKIEAAADQLRREADVARTADFSLHAARYEEILRRLDRIERRQDEGGK